MTTTFLVIGKIRGECPHVHKSLNAAQKCLANDQVGCKSQGGYSDRQIIQVNPQQRDGILTGSWADWENYLINEGEYLRFKE